MKENAYVRIEIDAEGSIKVDTNMNALGAIHMMSNTTQLMIEKHIEDASEKEEETIEQ